MSKTEITPATEHNKDLIDWIRKSARNESPKSAARYKSELKVRMANYEIQLRATKFCSNTRYKHMLTALKAVEMIMNDIPLTNGKRKI